MNANNVNSYETALWLIKLFDFRFWVYQKGWSPARAGCEQTMGVSCVNGATRFAKYRKRECGFSFKNLIGFTHTQLIRNHTFCHAGCSQCLAGNNLGPIKEKGVCISEEWSSYLVSAASGSRESQLSSLRTKMKNSTNQERIFCVRKLLLNEKARWWKNLY